MLKKIKNFLFQKRLPNVITVTVSADNLKNGIFTKIHECPLALAIKELYPEENSMASVAIARIRNKYYSFDFIHNEKLSKINPNFDGKPFDIILTENKNYKYI